MISKSKKRKQAVIDFFEYVTSYFLSSDNDNDQTDRIKMILDDGYELIENHVWGIAFENVATELVDNYFIIDRKGTALVRNVINLCELDKKWEFDLRRILSLGYVMGSWRLRDSEQSAKENKYTFYKPSKAITSQLKVGNLIKVIFDFDSTNEEHPSAERMWVEITEISGERFKGILDNDPFYIHELYAGDEVVVEHKHIIDHDLEVSEPNLVDKYYDRCFVTNKILYDGASINYIYREEPMETDPERDYVDTGWRILSGDESDEYMDNVENISLVSLGAVLSLDDSFIELLESEIGMSFERNEDGSFVRID